MVNHTPREILEYGELGEIKLAVGYPVFVKLPVA
jgi:hypothetical protein